MARAGAFSGSTFVFGAPLVSVHPIDNKFPDTKKKNVNDDDDDDEGSIQPMNRDGTPDKRK